MKSVLSTIKDDVAKLVGLAEGAAHQELCSVLHRLVSYLESVLTSPQNRDTSDPPIPESMKNAEGL
jgi:hypothetical protein